MTVRAHASADAIARVEALASRRLTADELRAWADSPIGPEELADSMALIRWFVRRYPTPAARLQWARKRSEDLARTTAHIRATSTRDD